MLIVIIRPLAKGVLGVLKTEGPPFPKGPQENSLFRVQCIQGQSLGAHGERGNLGQSPQQDPGLRAPGQGSKAKTLKLKAFCIITA